MWRRPVGCLDFIVNYLSLPNQNNHTMEYLHSSLRYLIVVFLLASIFISFTKWRGKKPFTKGDKMTYLMTLIFCHIQLVVGLILFFFTKDMLKVISDAGGMGAVMKNPLLRFIVVEHSLLMIIALVFITIGYSSAKRATTDIAKHKKTFIFYLIGFILIMVSIPWPFRIAGYGWI
jgi:heme/copper-type cytochrome/quinol oxidase subunit 4